MVHTPPPRKKKISLNEYSDFSIYCLTKYFLNETKTQLTRNLSMVFFMVGSEKSLQGYIFSTKKKSYSPPPFFSSPFIFFYPSVILFFHPQGPVGGGKMEKKYIPERMEEWRCVLSSQVEEYLENGSTFSSKLCKTLWLFLNPLIWFYPPKLPRGQ